MKFLIRRHGEKYTKTFTFNGGKTVYLKPMQFCAIHGEVDLVNFADFDTKHGKCNRIEQTAAVGLELPKTMAKAA